MRGGLAHERGEKVEARDAVRARAVGDSLTPIVDALEDSRRFAGHPVESIEQALDGDVAIFEEDGRTIRDREQGEQDVGRRENLSDAVGDILGFVENCAEFAAQR
jgi:hypothetical protein